MSRTIPRSRVIAALEALGLDADAVVELHMNPPTSVSVRWIVRDAMGDPAPLGEGAETRTTVYRVKEDE